MKAVDELLDRSNEGIEQKESGMQEYLSSFKVNFTLLCSPPRYPSFLFDLLSRMDILYNNSGIFPKKSFSSFCFFPYLVQISNKSVK